MKLSLAIQLAAEIHTDQTDKAGEEYILHCLAVMDMVREHGKEAMIVAILHDSLEDFQGSLKEKQKFEFVLGMNFSPEVIDAVRTLTREKNKSYEDYIEIVAQNYLARIVKIADLTHNMDPRRIPATQIVDKDFERWNKYRKALIRLERQ